jgi:hypothetical protein
MPKSPSSSMIRTGKVFLQILEKTLSDCNGICHAYCLMTNHYHLLMETPEANLSRIMKQINGIYTQRFNRKHQRVGHVYSGTLQIDCRRQGRLSAGAMPLYRAQPDSGRNERRPGPVPLVQFQGNGRYHQNTGLSEHGLDSPPVRRNHAPRHRPQYRRFVRAGKK